MNVKFLFKLFFALFFILLSEYGQSQTVNYQIYAIKFGERTTKNALSDVAVGSTSKDSVNVYFMYWLLKGSNGKTILVDAGFTADADINPKAIRYERPDKMLKELSVKPEEITDIIISHPHWDHIGGIDLYPQAMVWMQKEDYNYFVGAAWQVDGNKNGFNPKDVKKIVDRNLSNKLILIKGDGIEIMPNIKVYTGSKHTYEAQYVVVGSDENKVILASDNAWYYYNITSSLSIPVTHDASAYIKNMERMKNMQSNTDLIIPGHDPLVMSKFEKVADNIVRIKK